MNFIDLFCGCGGFSLGLKWASLEELAAIDFNHHAINVFKANFPESPNALEKDLRRFTPEMLREIIGDQEVDLIVGGPPCQGFSTVRQRDGSNSGNRIIDDDRRELYQELLKYVAYFRPKIFVMENVLGIRSAAGGHFFNKVQSEARDLGYRVHSEIIKAWEYGVPQKRERQFIFGTLLDLPIFSSKLFLEKTHSFNPNPPQKRIVTLWEAIGDLPPLKAGDGFEVMEYDKDRREKHLTRFSARYIENVLHVSENKYLTAHRARPHSERDLRDFKKIKEGETGAKTLLRHIELEAPYDRSTFKDRYTKQDRNSLCSTIVAHLSKDGLMFIHPTQNRSLTPREAARIQSFPDSFNFPVSRTQQYQLIGNAVPPLVGKAVGIAINKWFNYIKVDQKLGDDLEVNEEVAKNWVAELLTYKKNGNFTGMSNDLLIRGWKGILFLNYHLHPEGFFENGSATVEDSYSQISGVPELNENNLYIYERSGWPLILVPYAQEVRRRFELGSVSVEDYYCNSYLIQGFLHANKGK
jgi:DNA (cytosine-5)-methyltransferase 1